MLGYNELYEILRKEKYSENLQLLPKKFVEEFKAYIEENRNIDNEDKTLFSDSVSKSKRQLENAVSIFKELMLKRKRKILNLVFVATETGIMKRDYENMLPVEKEVFDKMVKIFEEGDKVVSKILNGKNSQTDENKMIMFTQSVEQFLDHEGNTIGPFKPGQLANLNADVAKILVQGEKATFVDES